MPLYLADSQVGRMAAITANVSTSTTTETVLLQAAVPGGTCVAGTTFRVGLYGYSTSTGTLTFRIRLGAAGTTADTAAFLSQTSVAQTLNWHAGMEGLINVRTLTTAQAEGFAFANTALLPASVAAPVSASVTTASTWFITLTAIASVAGFTAVNGVIERCGV